MADADGRSTDPDPDPSDRRGQTPAAIDGPGRADAAERDEVILAGIRAGDSGAFEELVRRDGPRLLAVARRILRSEEEARDCVQEAFLSAHRAIDRFEGRSRLATWLHRIVTNAALMQLRTRRARAESPIDPLLPGFDLNGFRAGPVQANALTPEELLQRADTRKLVREAMDHLPEAQRVVLLLRDIEGYSTAEAAQMLDTTDGALKVRLHRARTALKELLKPLFEEDFA